MSENGPLQPGEMTTRLKIWHVETGRGPLGEPLPAQEIQAGRAWAKMEPISNRKIRTAEQQQVVETALFTLHSRPDIDIDWKLTVTTRGNRVFTVRNVDRTQPDRIIITAEADTRHDRAGS